jgi:hypothetical protein
MSYKLVDIILKQFGYIKIDGKKYEGKDFQIFLQVDGGKLIQLANDKDLFIEVLGSCEYVKTTNGDIQVNGNANTVESTNGNITIGGDAGSAETTNGDIKAKSIGGSIKTKNGNVNIG